MTTYRKTMEEAYASMYFSEAKMSSAQIDRLKKAYEPMRGKRISTSNATKLNKMMDTIGRDKEALIQIVKADIPFVSTVAVNRLISNHGMKGAQINKLKKEETEVDEQWEKKLKKIRGNTPGAEGQRGAIEDDIAREKEKKNPNKKLIESDLDEAVDVKDFDSLKKGDTVTIKYKSAMSSGTATFKVTAKNMVGAGKKVEKVSLQSIKNPRGVKHFLYKRDNKVSFAQGDMGASVVSFKKEEVDLDEARQLKDPKKEMMVAKGGKVIVIKKTEWDQYKKKGYIQAEENELDEILPLAVAAIAKSAASSKKERKKKEEVELGIGEGYQVYVKSPTAKSGWIPQGQPHKTEADAKKDAKNFRGATRVVKEEVEIDEAKGIDPKTAKMIAKMITNDKLDYNFEYSLSKNNIADIKKQGGKPPRGVGPESGGSLYDLLKGLGDTDNDIYLDGGDLVDGAKTIGKWKGMTIGDMLKKARLRYEEVDIDEGKMSQLHQYIKDKKTPEQIAKLMKLDVKTIKALMSSHHPEDVEEGAAADARRAMRADPDMRQRGFSKDVTATDDDVKGASKNMIMQMRKAQSLSGNFPVEFADGKKFKVSKIMAIAVQQKFNALRRPVEKEKFQTRISKSYKDLLKVMKEELQPKNESVLDRIDRKIKENKNG